jgi:hypothetical protein
MMENLGGEVKRWDWHHCGFRLSHYTLKQKRKEADVDIVTLARTKKKKRRQQYQLTIPPGIITTIEKQQGKTNKHQPTFFSLPPSSSKDIPSG